MGAIRRLIGRRGPRERGAVAVEAALITPLLVIMLFGIIEMSLLMRDHIATSSAVRVGARVASAAADAGPGTCPTGPSPPPCTPADAPQFAQAAADAIQRAGTALPKDSIEEIWIYEANTKGYPGPWNGTSTAMVCGANCVKYVWQDSVDKFEYASGSWTSSTVNACVNEAEATSVGIYMQATHMGVTGMFGSTIGLADRAVMKFEPLKWEECMPGFHP